MSDASFASLSSTLLARKGGAKPAMRPQSGIAGPVDGKEAAANLEDLGWNDMGEETPASSAQVVSIKPAAAANQDAPAAQADAPNQVRQSLDRIAAHIEKPAVAKPVERKSAPSQGKRAAFTLRLDHDRHLMLRLACTVRNCSAQQLVTDALDNLLAEMPEIASLAAQVNRDSQ
ncbi:hypothetical protein [Qipengyuania marisflavi]|uniref:Uncharacterized protein n=1 Tax=Qipengyuania marisflavi TaxID=2486356 RepID=A0A5S3P8C5_9SPHN|nr:hypothetical protein [Qipengyuania marisflavi]TMM48684.1 hypothetical protein FEV51_04585 [Qipengyuania marisflavi]